MITTNKCNSDVLCIFRMMNEMSLEIINTKENCDLLEQSVPSSSTTSHIYCNNNVLKKQNTL